MFFVRHDFSVDSFLNKKGRTSLSGNWWGTGWGIKLIQWRSPASSLQVYLFLLPPPARLFPFPVRCCFPSPTAHLLPNLWSEWSHFPAWMAQAQTVRTWQFQNWLNTEISFKGTSKKANTNLRFRTLLSWILRIRFTLKVVEVRLPCFPSHTHNVPPTQVSVT